MARTRPWEISDELWLFVEPLVPTSPRVGIKTYKRKPGGGRKPRYSNRLYFAAMVYVLRTGIIWNALPREKFEGVTSSGVHQKFLTWTQFGFFLRLWQEGVAEYDELEGIAWEWQSADGSNLEAPLAQESVGPNPTDRGKKWKQAKRPRGRAWRPVVNRRMRSKPSRQQAPGTASGEPNQPPDNM